MFSRHQVRNGKIHRREPWSGISIIEPHYIREGRERRNYSHILQIRILLFKEGDSFNQEHNKLMAKLRLELGSSNLYTSLFTLHNARKDLQEKEKERDKAILFVTFQDTISNRTAKIFNLRNTLNLIQQFKSYIIQGYIIGKMEKNYLRSYRHHKTEGIGYLDKIAIIVCFRWHIICSLKPRIYIVFQKSKSTFFFQLFAGKGLPNVENQ